MELSQLKYFEGAARYESLSKAAVEMHISQPALSKSIARLEGELGVKLFDRTGKRIALNDYGRFFLSNVTRILRELEDSSQAVQRLGVYADESLSIGVFGPQRFAHECTCAFLEANPTVRVAFEARWLSTGQHLTREYDAVFFPRTAEFSQLPGIAYAATHVKAAVPKGHRLASARSIALRELSDEPFVLVNAPSDALSHSYALCDECGFYPIVRIITTSRAAQMAFIRAGKGVGLVDSPVLEHEVSGVALLDLSADVADRELCITCRPRNLLSETALRYMEFAFDYLGMPADSRVWEVFEGN